MELLRKDPEELLTVDSLFDRIKDLHGNPTEGINEYRVGEVKLPVENLETVPDIMDPKGGDRLRRFGAIFGITVIPDYGQVMLHQSILPRIEERLVDGDDLDQIRDRIHQLVDLAIDIEELRAQDEGKAEELLNKVQAHFTQGPPQS